MDGSLLRSQLRIAFIAKRMGDLDLPQLRAQAVCAWSLHRYQKILDNAGMWLSDAEAQELGQSLFLISSFLYLPVSLFQPSHV